MRTQKSLYDRDFNAWIFQQINFIQNKEFENLDIQHLLEEMETLGNSNPTALKSHLVIILLHMLKQKHQPDLSSKSWKDSISSARIQIDQIIEDNPSLKQFLNDKIVIDYCFEKAKRKTSKETSIDIRKFEKECPWTLKEILGE